MIAKIVKYNVVVLLLSLIFPVIADAQLDYTVFPRLSIEGRYSDNYYASERDKKDGFITTVSPGILISVFTRNSMLDLDYSLNSTGYFIEDEADRFEYFNQRGFGAFRADILKNFSIFLQDEIVKTEDVISIDENFARERRRVAFLRNTSGGELAYHYKEGSEIAAGYAFTILDYFDGIVDDSKRHDFRGRITHDFNIRNTGSASYRHSITDYRRLNDPGQTSRDDLYEDEIRGRFTHYFTPRFSSGISYGYLELHHDEPLGRAPIDYHVHDAEIESAYFISSSLRADGRIGLFFREVFGTDTWEEGLVYRAGLTYTYSDFMGTAAYEGGYSTSYINPERLEFYEYQRVIGDVTYNLIRDILILRGRGSYMVNRYPDSTDRRRDNIWNAGGGMDYRVFNWLLFSLDYNHTARNSNIQGLHYVENSYLARITISYRYSTMERDIETRERRERERRAEMGIERREMERREREEDNAR